VSAGPDARPLDNPVRSSLLGPHARFAQRHGGVLRYPPPVSPFAALPDDHQRAGDNGAGSLRRPDRRLPSAEPT